MLRARTRGRPDSRASWAMRASCRVGNSWTSRTRQTTSARRMLALARRMPAFSRPSSAAASLADAGRVHQDERLPVADEEGVGRVPGRARDLADDEPLFAGQAVDDGGLADVGPADDGDAQGLLALPGRTGRGQGGGDGLLEAVDIDLVLRRDEMDVLLPQPVVLGRPRFFLDGGIDLVDDDEERQAAPLEIEVELFLGRGDVALAVEDEEDEVGRDRLLEGLGPDPVAQGLVGDAEEAARVDEGEAPVPEDALGGQAVPGHARVGVDEGLALAEDPVEQGRFADVGEADDDDPGELRHGRPRVISRRGNSRGGRPG